MPRSRLYIRLAFFLAGFATCYTQIIFLDSSRASRPHEPAQVVAGGAAAFDVRQFVGGLFTRRTAAGSPGAFCINVMGAPGLYIRGATRAASEGTAKTRTSSRFGSRCGYSAPQPPSPLPPKAVENRAAGKASKARFGMPFAFYWPPVYDTKLALNRSPEFVRSFLRTLSRVVLMSLPPGLPPVDRGVAYWRA